MSARDLGSNNLPPCCCARRHIQQVSKASSWFYDKLLVIARCVGQTAVSQLRAPRPLPKALKVFNGSAPGSTQGLTQVEPGVELLNIFRASAMALAPLGSNTVVCLTHWQSPEACDQTMWKPFNTRWRWQCEQQRGGTYTAKIAAVQ